MKIPIELRKSYKEETGHGFKLVEFAFKDLMYKEEWDTLTLEEFIDWLVEKLTDAQKQIELIKMLHNYKEDYEDALYEIGQLQDQLENAEDEIIDLNRTQ